MIVGAMLGLVGIYLIKNLFLAFLAWRQTRFVFGMQVQLRNGSSRPICVSPTPFIFSVTRRI